MWERLRQAFTRQRGIEISDADSIAEGEARCVELGPSGPRPPGRLGRSGISMAVLCRVEGELFALDVRCPHEGGMIIDGPLVDGRYAVCPLHHFLFDPRTGRQKEGFCGPAHRYRLEQRDGVTTLYAR
jgi:nitrite reductase/ring-hydroxylating ferredoxin subunit